MRVEISATALFLLCPPLRPCSFLFLTLPRIYISQVFVSTTTLVKVAVTSQLSTAPPSLLWSSSSPLFLHSLLISRLFIQKDCLSVPSPLLCFGCWIIHSIFRDLSHLLQKPPDFDFLLTIPLFCCSTREGLQCISFACTSLSKLFLESTSAKPLSPVLQKNSSCQGCSDFHGTKPSCQYSFLILLGGSAVFDTVANSLFLHVGQEMCRPLVPRLGACLFGSLYTC